MEEQEVQEEQGKKREGFLSRSQMIIIGVFALLNIGILLAVFGSRMFGGSGEGSGSEARPSPLENTALIDLGRIEVGVPLDPTNQTSIHCSATVSLQVPLARQQALQPMIMAHEAAFKELARHAFRNASPADIATENLAGVKHTIQRGINDLLGEEAVTQVYFGDYRSY